MDKERFGEMILANERQFYRIAKSILRKDEDCQDAAQEAIARAFGHLGSLKEDAYARTWFIRILIRECYTLLRKSSREIPHGELPAASSAADTDYSELYEALSQLEADYRVALVLYYLEGFRILEIADILNIPEGTVKSRLHRGRQRLSELLKEADS